MQGETAADCRFAESELTAEREQPHDPPYPPGKVARDVGEMEEREGCAKRDMFLRNTAEKCRKGREISTPIKENNTEGADQPAPLDLKCGILELRMRL